jgi:hypothetical protein
MYAALCAIAVFVINLFKSRRRLEAENLRLRLQPQVALRKAPARLRLRGSDRAIMVCIARLWPELVGSTQDGEAGDNPALAPCWFSRILVLKSRPRAGRPRIGSDLWGLIRRMSWENPLWGAPGSMASSR